MNVEGHWWLNHINGSTHGSLESSQKVVLDGCASEPIPFYLVQGSVLGLVLFLIFSSPEPLGSQGELIGWP